MKRALAFPLILSLFFLASCANLETNAYKTLGAVSITVDAAMKAWGQAVRDGKTTVEQESNVRLTYIEYQSAMVIAKLAVDGYRTNPDATQLNKAVDAASAAGGQLAGFIYSLFPKGTQ